MKLYYDYKELREKALKGNKQDRLNLLKWCENYNNEWNGKTFDIDNGKQLKPIYKGIRKKDENGEYEQYEIIDAEIIE